MSPRRLSTPGLALVIALVALAATGAGAAWAAFSARTTNSGNTFVAAASFADVTSTTIATSNSCLDGAVRQGGSFHVYANVTGSPPAVTADLSAVSAGQVAAQMVAGSFSAGGKSYNYRSAAITADAALAAGSKTYTVAPVGGELQSGSVVVDNTPPRAEAIDTVNGGTTPGRMEAGDSITFTYSEPVDSCTLLAGWTGEPPVPMVVAIQQNLANDPVTLWNASFTALLPLQIGPIGWQSDLVDTDTTFGRTGTPTLLSRNGAAITAVFGTQAGESRLTDPATFSWAASSAVTDAAGNPATTGTVSETGPLDVDF